MALLNTKGVVVDPYLNKRTSGLIRGTAASFQPTTYDKEDLQKMSTEELHAMAKRYSGIASNRFKRLEYATQRNEWFVSQSYEFYTNPNTEGPLLRAKMRYSKSFSKNRLVSSILASQEFLNNKTSTVEGSRQVLREEHQRLGLFKTNARGEVVSAEWMTRSQVSLFWDAYQRVLHDPSNVYSSTQIQEIVRDAMPYARDIDQLMEVINKVLDQKYLEEQAFENAQRVLDAATPFTQEDFLDLFPDDF